MPTVDDVLEDHWSIRARPVRGRELRIELAMTAAFFAAVGALVAASPAISAPHPAVILVVLAYALAARVEFPIGTAIFVPTQLFLIPLFVLAPAQLVPLLVFCGLLIPTLAGAALGRSSVDRAAFCAGDAVHALGPALVVVWLAGGDGTQASLLVLVPAFAAQIVADLVSSTLHELLVLRVRPSLYLRGLSQMWIVDAALTSFGVLAAYGALTTPLAALAPLPIVGLLAALANDRTRKIEAAHGRLQALQRERGRLRLAVRRVGDALASNLDTVALVETVARAVEESLDGCAVRATTFAGGQIAERIPVREQASASAVLDAVERMLLAGESLSVQAQQEGLHAVAGRIGEASDPEGIVAVARVHPFSDDERELLAYLCEQATVSAANGTRHEALQKAEARMRHRAFHDPLTGLANRALFCDRVDAAVKRHAHGRFHAAVLFIDLDGFKLVNDTLGHDAGDELLVTVALRLTHSVEPGDTVARFGGDEFAVLLEDLDDHAAAEQIAARLRGQLVTPVRLRDRDVVVRGSVGVALAAQGLSSDDILRRADLAMYAAKRGTDDRPVRFHADMQTQANTRMELVQDLRGAAGRGELELRYQPVVDLATGAIHAGEALMRWRHPRRGLLDPAEFIAYAEESGTIAELGRFGLDEACRTVRTWPEQTLVSVNVSAHQLRSAALAEDVQAALRSHDLPAERLMLEVTESVLAQPDIATLGNLKQLRDAGVTIALDDFGTGFSSLSYLGRFRIDVLKLDRSFLAEMDHEPAQASLVAGIIRLGQSLGIRLIAEGIERQSQLDALQRLGVDLGQGYLLGAPIEAAAFAQRLASAPRVLEAIHPALPLAPAG